MSLRMRLAVVLGLCGLLEGSSALADVEVGDAYVRQTGDQWTIGTGAVDMTFEVRDDNFLLSHFTNKLAKPAREYVGEQESVNPLGEGVCWLNEPYVVDVVWEKFLPARGTIDLGADKLQLNVKKDEMIGFSVGPHGSYSCDQILWPAAVDYADGDRYESADDVDLNQGPIWHYNVYVPHSGLLEELDAVEMAENVKQKVRIPKQGNTLRAPGNTPIVGPTTMHPSPNRDAVRVWKAPKDGVVTVSGIAQQIGGGDTDIQVLKIRKRATADRAATKTTLPWKIVAGDARQVNAGGRAAVQLDLTVEHGSVRYAFHLLAYPGAPVIRQWAEIENRGDKPYHKDRNLYTIALRPEGDKFTNYWMVGGNSQPDQGEMRTSEIATDFRQDLASSATYHFVPWMAFRRDGGSGDGCFVALEYLGDWKLAVDRQEGGPVRISTSAIGCPAAPVAPGQSVELPPVFCGVFDRDLDDMGARLYDWQYEYLWDYTHDDWFTKMPFTVSWYGDSDNLQQQWAGHLGDLDMRWTDYLRTTGMDLLWEDAGWSASCHWWGPNHEGPDFAETRRYLTKNDMKLVVWMMGHQTTGVLDTKVGAWGNFQRRTDGLGFELGRDKEFRTTTDAFLRKHPRSSYHTCAGGSTYAHTFEVQRFTDINYDTDGPGSAYTNANWSYLDLPDKWFDNLAYFTYGAGGGWRDDVGYRAITQVPKWGLDIGPRDIEQLRIMCDLYRYLLREGVAGRWSYIAHPIVTGDASHHYTQRVSHDRKRSLLVFKHRSTGAVTIRPQGLLPNEDYLVEFEAEKTSFTRSGADLMADGLTVVDQKPNELVYFNLPNRPRSGRDQKAPAAPGRVLVRRETNIGFTGTGVYWSEGADDNWISYYEVRRGDQILGRAGTGRYYFDRSEGWSPDAVYSIRTIDGDGNASDWASAAAIPSGPRVAAVLGGLFPVQGREGWRYETTTDEKQYEPMMWVPPAKNPSADFSGTTIQPGGAEGYWEKGDARIGRGWQQASKDVMCVRTWTAPQAGAVQVVGRAMKEYYHRDQGEPVRVKILHNGKQAWPESGWAVVPVGCLQGVTHNFSAQVVAGDTLRFVVDRGTAPEHDTIGWMPRITYSETASDAEAQPPVRILCGSEQPYVDKTGNVWAADSCFTGGRGVATDAKIAGTLPTLDDQTLYQRGRCGKDFSYAIPVKPGLYTVRLKFAEPDYEWFFGRPLTVSVNGRDVMRNSDICQSANGCRKAHERVFNYVVPDASGNIQLRFRGGWEPMQKTDEAMVQAIEILPELRPVVRIDCGSPVDFVDWNSYVWAADSPIEGGQTIESRSPVAHASPTLHDQRLYQTARVGKDIVYAIPVPPGLYNVHLKFAELWQSEVGKRPMNIDINGRRFWEKWDPSVQAERVGMSADIRAEDVVPDKNGEITIRVSAAGDNEAILQGIEIE